MRRLARSRALTVAVAVVLTLVVAASVFATFGG